MTTVSPLREFDCPCFTSATFRLDRPSQYLINRARRDDVGGYTRLKSCLSSATVYVGHLMLSTTEEQLYQVFSTCGKIRKVIMGLNAQDQSPTGFCFVVFKNAQGALNAVKYLNKTKINGRTMEIDLDPGFEDGRQYGRGENGAQKSQSYGGYGGYGGQGGHFAHHTGRGRGRGGGGGGRGRGRGGRGGRQGGRGGRGGRRDRERERAGDVYQPQYNNGGYNGGEYNSGQYPSGQYGVPPQ